MNEPPPQKKQKKKKTTTNYLRIKNVKFLYHVFVGLHLKYF